ncbi:class I SAM-dependent methyltransferase, partial [Rubripirellula sp.]|nr:class I SAM-dependent methyltransferase [Rubripirellula sp.]
MSETDRFEFGKNWKAFLASLDQQRIERAVESLRQTLGVESMEGKCFIDLGCGSGLFSLAAHQLGAEVTSIDFDMESVQCTEFLREHYAAKSPVWKIEQGSVLDASFLGSLGQGDYVYSWGVLHHTGAMQDAIALASERTRV